MGPAFELAGVGIELANAFGQFVGGHGIFVVHPAEGFFVQMNLRFFAGGGSSRRKGRFDLAFGGGHLVEQIRADGQQVTAGQKRDLFHFAEARAHHLGLIAILFVVVVDARDGGNARILVDRNVFAAVLGFVVIVNASDEGRNQGDLGFGTRNGLSKAKEQREVAMDAFALQLLGRSDAFPGAGNFDQTRDCGWCHRLRKA